MLYKIKGLFHKHGIWKSVLILFIKIIYKISCPLIFNIIHYTTQVNNNRVLFQSSPDFSDNARALFDYMISCKYNERYEIIWLVKKPMDYNKYKTNNIKFIKSSGNMHRYLTVRAFYYTQTSKIIFFTHSFNFKKISRKQLLVNLWHGCGYKAAKNAVEGKSENLNFDFCLVPGDIFIKTKAEFWGCSQEKMLPLGYPRYKWFFDNKLRALQFLSNISNINAKYKIIWMPTYRKTESRTFRENQLETPFDIPIISNIQEFKRLNEYCRELNINLIIKRHPKQLEYNNSNHNLSNIIFLTNEQLEKADIQLYELLCTVDALITDYSSVAIDFLLIDKPIGFTLDDFYEYKKVRGFVFDDPLQYMPGEHIFTYDDLLKFIKDIEGKKDEYKEQRAKVRRIAHNETDDYCDRILKCFKLTLDM